MTEQRKSDINWTDASLQYYHKNTLKYLLELEIVEYQEQPNEWICTVETTSHFRELIKNAQKENDNQMSSFEDVFQEATKNKGIKLRKNLMYDMIKLIGFDLAQTSLKYYHKRTLDCLLNLGIVMYFEEPDSVSCSAEYTPLYQKLMGDTDEKNTSKMVSLDSMFKNLARKKQMKVSKKLRYDMIKLMSYIDKFGGIGKIWIKEK
jgi:hypothetical protein